MITADLECDNWGVLYDARNIVIGNTLAFDSLTEAYEVLTPHATKLYDNLCQELVVMAWRDRDLAYANRTEHKSWHAAR